MKWVDLGTVGKYVKDKYDQNIVYENKALIKMRKKLLNQM